MKKGLLVLMFLASSSLFAGARFSVGIGVGPAYGYFAEPRTRVRLCFRLLLSSGTTLCLASGLLGSATLRWSRMGRSALRRPSLL
jgi:hypothetical protein